MTTHYPVVVRVEMRPKKGTTETAVFGITQDRPYPDMAGTGSHLDWRNDSGVLFRSYGNEPKGLPDSYHVHQLTSTDGPHEGSRRDHAGYEGNAGTLTLRGRDLGEVYAEVKRNQYGEGGYWVSWKVRSREYPTDTERAYLEEQAQPAILRAIDDGYEKLRRHAIDGIRATLAERIKETRARIDKLEREAAEAMAKLEAGEAVTK